MKRNFKKYHLLFLFCLLTLTGCKNPSQDSVSATELTISQTQNQTAPAPATKRQQGSLEHADASEAATAEIKKEATSDTRIQSGIWSENGSSKEDILKNGGSYLEIFDSDQESFRGSYTSIQAISHRIAQIDLETSTFTDPLSCEFIDDGFGNAGTLFLKLQEEHLTVQVTLHEMVSANGNWSLQSAQLIPIQEHNETTADDVLTYRAEINNYREKIGKTDTDDREFIFDTDHRVYSVQELNELTDIQRSVFKNEIYARHGYLFQSPAFNQLFKQYRWYHPLETNDLFDPNCFTETEKENLTLILQYTN